MVVDDLDDHAEAARIATAAGELLLEIRTRLDQPDADAGVVRDAGDRRAHHFIVAELDRTRPYDAVLSEEGKDSPARLEASGVWIVDPLDGTREFGEAGRTDWAVHVALVVGGRPVAAAVALPARGLTLSTAAPPPTPPPRPAGEAPRVLVSRTRAPAVATAVAEELGGELVPLGSAGAKAMAVVLDEGDIYIHAGGQYEWDSAAPVGVALAAGLHASRLDGAPLVYNRQDPWMPDLLISKVDLADAVLDAIAGAG